MQISKISSNKSFSGFCSLCSQPNHVKAIEPIIPNLVRISALSSKPDRSVSLLAQSVMQEVKSGKDYTIKLPAIRFLASFIKNGDTIKLGESSVILQKSGDQQYQIMCAAYKALKDALKPNLN